MNQLTQPSVKYRIQDNIDFYHALQEETDLDYNDTHKCRITHETLDPSTAVTLECHHSFNYLPLYKYVLLSKTSKFNNLETHTLKASQVKCPFCRHVQNQLLPAPPPGIPAKLIHGVNVLEFDSVRPGKCAYPFANGEPECCCASVYLAFRDNQTYCFHHRAWMKKKWEQEDKQKHRCSHVCVRGKQRGQPCGKTITTNVAGGLCVSHAKQKERHPQKEKKNLNVKKIK